MRRPSRLTTSAARASAASCWASPARRRTASRPRCASWPRQSQISDRLDRELASRPALQMGVLELTRDEHANGGDVLLTRLGQRAVAEFVGTALLLIAVIGSGIM